MTTINNIDEKTLGKYLQQLEAMLDTEHIERTEELQRKAFRFEPVDHVPTAVEYPVGQDKWPSFSFEEIFNNPAKMLLNELRMVYVGAKLKDDRLYGIRPNYGTGIIASMFGCETKVLGHSLPIGLHVSQDKLEEILEKGVPDFNVGLFNKVVETARYFRETLKPYPTLSEAVGIELFDIQGTFDNASIIWGSDIYLALFDTPDKVKKLMGIVAETISATVKEFRRVTASPLDEQGGAWNFIGGICLRDDSCVNISGEQYLEFVKPFNSRLLKEFDGWIHFCGKAHQWWRYLMDIPGLKGINPYQGDFYDLYEMFEVCEVHSLPIMQWTVPLDQRCRERIRTGFGRVLAVADYDQACKALETLHSTGHADLDEGHC